MNNKKNKNGKRRKVKIGMSVELEVLMDKGKDENEQLNNIAKIYASCFGDKDVKIEEVKFID